MIGMYLCRRRVNTYKERCGWNFLLLCISSIPKRVETTCPRCNYTHIGEKDESGEPEYTNRDDRAEKELAELFRRDVRSYKSCESNNLKQTKDA